MQGLQWIFRARTPEAEELFKGRPLPDVEERGNLDENIEDGREPPSPSFRPIGHVSLVSVLVDSLIKYCATLTSATAGLV